ncbi:MAG: hypothetical protein LBL76_10990 [Treponema sp.]|jgi:hypothetical protein|nr:hypothetical protein [Treponema sp.]
MGITLLKLEIHLVVSILFLFLYNLIFSFLKDMVHYPVYHDISLGLALVSIGYSYIILNLSLAILPSLKWKLFGFILYGIYCFISLHDTPLKFMFFVSGGIMVSIITILLIHFILDISKNKSISIFPWIILISLTMFPVGICIWANLYQEWKWMLTSGISTIKWIVSSNILSLLINILLSKMKIESKLSHHCIDIIMMFIFSLISSVFFYWSITLMWLIIEAILVTLLIAISFWIDSVLSRKDI